VTALLEVGAEVGWTDLDASAAARRAMTRPGRIADLVEWLAATQGRFPPEPPKRTRCVLLAPATPPVAELADGYGIGPRNLELSPDPGKAFAQGLDAADHEVEEGADLLVLAGHDDTAAPAGLISVLTGLEPVALLPRGADAVDTKQWIAAAGQLRDRRRELAALRSRPDELLVAAGSPATAAAAGFLMRAAARRTGVVLDGAAVLVAALVCIDSQPLAAHWWQLADSGPGPAHGAVAGRLELRPLLDLGGSTGDGLAGLLAADLLRVVGHAGVVGE
jgi:nicotinate-nucleotide--dimethylbenzimidazole phosphoribosyltransferase